jgi:tRNA dimethylallyltransferase
LTGQPISAHQRRHRFTARAYETLTVGLTTDRARLYQTIDRRFDEMIRQGLVDEVRALLAAGCDPECAPLKSVGYRQITAAVRGDLELSRAIELAKRDSRRLAKRQLTWFRSDSEIVWIDVAHEADKAFDLLSEFFSRQQESVD